MGWPAGLKRLGTGGWAGRWCEGGGRHGLCPALPPRRLLAVRTKELRSLRRLAQEVLLQRSDVEAFLVASIQQVGGWAEVLYSGWQAGPVHSCPELTSCHLSIRQVRAELMAQAGSGGAAPSAAATAGSQAALGGSGSSAAAEEGEDPGGEASTAAAAGAGAGLPSYSSSLGSAVDVRELSWPDRERILRLLFSKINRAAAAPAPVPAVPSVARTAALSEVAVEVPLRGLPAATEAGPAGLA